MINDAPEERWKVGEVVEYHMDGFGLNSLKTVEKVSPTGRATVGGVVFDPISASGSAHQRSGRSSRYGRSARISRISEEDAYKLEREIRKQAAIGVITSARASDLEHISMPTLESWVDLINDTPGDS